MAQNRLERMRYHSLKKMCSILHGFRPSAVRGRFFGPKVLINSIPKAGTHLVESALEEFPYLRNAAERTLRGWESADDRTLSVIRTLPKGMFFTAHLPAHKEVIDAVAENDVRVIFVVRDPRDIVISNYNYSTYIDLSHPTHDFFKKMPDDDTRLEKVIIGEAGILTPIAEIMDLFEPWFINRNAITIRFEDLVGLQGGGSKVTQIESLQKIAIHLGIDMKVSELKAVASKVFNSDSLTFSSGQVGKWRSVFKPYHFALFKDQVGARLTTYGYRYDSSFEGK